MSGPPALRAMLAVLLSRSPRSKYPFPQRYNWNDVLHTGPACCLPLRSVHFNYLILNLIHTNVWKIQLSWGWGRWGCFLFKSHFKYYFGHDVPGEGSQDGSWAGWRTDPFCLGNQFARHVNSCISTPGTCTHILLRSLMFLWCSKCSSRVESLPPFMLAWKMPQVFDYLDAGGFCVIGNSVSGLWPVSEVSQTFFPPRNL